MTEIVPSDDQPIVTPAEAQKVLEMMRAFDYFKRNVLSSGDIAQIQGKPFVKKSGWSKYALACNVSTEVREERVEERDGARIYHFTYRATAPSGRYAEAVGTASEREKTHWNHPEHDVRTLAQTRAFNRSISNLVGGGEISAEEMRAGPESAGSPSPGRASTILVQDDQRRETQPPPEEYVKHYLEEGNLPTGQLVIYRYGHRLYIDPPKFPKETWESYDDALGKIGAEWRTIGRKGRWEIDLEEEP